MRIKHTAMTILCAAVLFIPASRDIETAGAAPVVRAAAPLPVSLQAACQAAASDPEGIDALLAGIAAGAQPNDVCVDTITCGGCCGNVNQVRAFLRCCERGDGVACAQRFGCQ